MNNRAFIRQKIKEALLQSEFITNTFGANKVFINKLKKPIEDEMPLILIETQKEDCEVFELSPRTYKRKMTVTIASVIKAKEGDVDDDLDEIAGEIEQALNNDRFLQDTVEDTELDSIEFNAELDAEHSFGALRNTYSVTYFSEEIPNHPTSDFAEINIKMDSGTIESEDQVDLPTDP